MKKQALTILFFCLSQLVVAQQSEKGCMFEQKLQTYELSEHYLKTQAAIAKQSKQMLIDKSETVFYIPVVVHVIYQNANENISRAQIESQIQVLNEDYGKLNSDTTNVEAGFSKANSRIQFCLAKRDPNGNKTDGVTRTSTSIDDIGLTEQYYQLAPIWDRDYYLNIWVCDLGSQTAGFAFSPGASADRDGVVIHYSNFGRTGTLERNYDLGRTTTHEVGHWFNLLHPWGRNPNCANDDGVSDTPDQGAIYQECPNPPQSSCGSKDMLSNFMGYVYDRCMGNFTEGQKERMRQAIVNSRTELILSKGCLAVGIEEQKLADQISIGPNPSAGIFTLKFEQKLNSDLNIEVFNLSGKAVNPKTKKLNNGYAIDMSQFSGGIYFLKLSNQTESLTKKLILQSH